MPDKTELMVPYIINHGYKSLETTKRELNADDGQLISDLERSPYIMRLFVCLIDLYCNYDLILSALQPRKPYGQENYTVVSAASPDLA